MKKNKILDTAMELFSDKGYESTTISKIADEAGVAKGSVYTYFTSKEDLLENVIQYGVEKISDDLFNEFTFDKGFEYMINNFFKVLDQNKYFYTIYFSLIFKKELAQRILPHFEPVMNKYMTLLVSYFAQKGEKDPEASALLFGSLMDGVSMGYLVAGDYYPVEKVKKELIEKFK